MQIIPSTSVPHGKQ